MHVTVLEAGNRVQLPAEWVEEIGLSGQAAMERVAGGILIHSPAPSSWDTLFRDKIALNPAASSPESEEINDDDCLY